MGTVTPEPSNVYWWQIEQQFCFIIKSKKPRAKVLERDPEEDFANEHLEMKMCLCHSIGGEGGSVSIQTSNKNHLPQVNQERMLQALHDLKFPEHVPNFIPLDALLLVHVLHGVHFLRVSLLHDAYLSDSQREEHSGQRWKRNGSPHAFLLRGSSLCSENLLSEQLELCHHLSASGTGTGPAPGQPCQPVSFNLCSSIGGAGPDSPVHQVFTLSLGW